MFCILLNIKANRAFLISLPSSKMHLNSMQFLLNVSGVLLYNGAAVLNYITNSKLVSIVGILLNSN